MMKTILPPLIIGIIIASIWGYFSDLKNGDTTTFTIRILVVPTLLVLLTIIKEAKNKEKN